MSKTSFISKFRNSSVASAIFVVGAGIGWHFADLMFEGEAVMPTVAAIRLEGALPQGPARSPAPSRPEQPGAVREHPSLTPQESSAQQRQPQSVAPNPQVEEERRLADALLWADKYRQKQAADEWAKIASYQVQMQRLAQAQSVQLQVADASAVRAKAMQPGKTADKKIIRVKADASNRRMAHRPRARINRTSGHGTRTLNCPLQWLQTVLVDPIAERRGGRRPFRIG